MMKIYLTLLSVHDRFLNFRAKSGISATRSIQNRSMNSSRKRALNLGLTRNACCPTMRLPQNRALAGVGSPMKLLVWRVSRLNFARRRAENAAMRKAE